MSTRLNFIQYHFIPSYIAHYVHALIHVCYFQEKMNQITARTATSISREVLKTRTMPQASQ